MMVIVIGYVGFVLIVAVTKSGFGMVNFFVIILAGLVFGLYMVMVMSWDIVGNISAVVLVTLMVDIVGLVIVGVIVAFNLINGKIGLNSGVLVVWVTVMVIDVASAVGGAEGFIDTVGVLGVGFFFSLVDG